MLRPLFAERERRPLSDAYLDPGKYEIFYEVPGFK